MGARFSRYVAQALIAVSTPGCSFLNVEPQSAIGPDVPGSTAPSPEANDVGSNVAWATCLQVRIKASDNVVLEQGFGVGFGILGLGAAGVSTALASRSGVSDEQTTEWAIAAAGGMALTALAVYLLTTANAEKRALATANAGCPPPPPGSAATAPVTTADNTAASLASPDGVLSGSPTETWAGARLTRKADKWKVPFVEVAVDPQAESREALERLYENYADTGLAKKRSPGPSTTYVFILTDTVYGRKLRSELDDLARRYRQSPAP